MTLLVDIIDQSWMTHSEFRGHLTGLVNEQIQFYPDIVNPEKIKMLACDRLRSGLVKQLPNLELVQKLGAGVETIVNDPDLPATVRITRLRPKVAAMEMAQFALAAVLWDIHNFEFHRKNQKQKNWIPKAPRDTSKVTIGVLGLGTIGGFIANLAVSLSFSVVGWSRQKKSMAGVICRSGMDELDSVLNQCDYVVSALPDTKKTTNLFDISRFKSMRHDAMLINIGRGSLINETDLVVALEQDYLRHAVLDVFEKEPLLISSLLWQHPKITITPHVSGWHLNEGLSEVGENYQLLLTGQSLIHEINRDSGY